MTLPLTRMDALSIVAGNQTLRRPRGRCGHSGLCFGPAISCPWIILVLDLGSAQPHLAASVGSTSVTNNPFAASCDAFCQSACLKVQPVLVLPPTGFAMDEN